MKKQNNLGKDNIKTLVWRIAIPSMLAQFVSVLYSIVDRMYIGNIPEIGDIALAGVGVCGPVVTMISSFASLIGVGGSPLMSIRMGEGREKEARKILSNCFMMLCVLSVCFDGCDYGSEGADALFIRRQYTDLCLCGQLFHYLFARHDFCTACHRHESVYHMSGICQNRDDFRYGRCSLQYCA